MAIYVDTNVLPRSGQLDTLELSLVQAIARETGHEIVIPRLVLHEAGSQFLRTAEAAFEVVHRAHRDARSFGNIPVLPEFPIPGELAREFERNVEALGRVIEMPAGAGDEALRREAHRLRPAREGKGARDAAIWLSVKADHEAIGGTNYLFSKNTSDFGDPADRSRLHDDLLAELPDENLRLAASLEQLLELLAAEDDSSLDLDFVRDHDECTNAVAAFIDGSDLDALSGEVLGEPVGGQKRRLYVAGAIVSLPIGVNDEKGFRVEGRRIGVGWSRWRVTLPLGVLERVGSGMAASTVEVVFEANFQLWVRIEEDGTVSAETTAMSSLRGVT